MKNQSMTRLAAGLSLMALAGTSAFAAAGSYSTSAGWTAAQLVDFLIPNGVGINVVGGSESFTGVTGTTGLGVPIYGVNSTGPLGTGTIGTADSRTSAGEFVGGSSINGGPASTTGRTGIPFDEGVILSTGNLFTSAGTTGSPNNLPSTTTAWRTPGSSILESEIPSTAFLTADAATLSFRFTLDPFVTAVSFQYAFGSEEYLEFVGSGFNDAFAFVLTDITASTSANLAKIGSSPVSINTINNVLNAAYYANNPFVGLSGGSTFLSEFDGIAGGYGATPLFASSSVNAAHTYQIDLVIADVLDVNYDSAVYLKADSFTTELPPGAVPEPSTYVGALALAGLIARRLRRKA